MNGELVLDDTFDSGVEGCPGARFVLDLKVPPLEVTDMDAEIDPENPTVVHGTSALPDLPEQFNVLFTDDDMALRKLFARALKRVVPTWNIAQAANGETCLRLVETNKFDVSLSVSFCFVEQTYISFARVRAHRFSSCGSAHFL